MLGTNSVTQLRSVQRNAGKPDRKPSDHGGHLIARRFGGPEIPENHIAQAANINRGLYRKLENKWDKALGKGKEVEVEITPNYTRSSKRPDSIEVRFKINGVRHKKVISNSRKGK